MNTTEFIVATLLEEAASNDYAVVPSITGNTRGRAILKIRESGIIAGLALAQEIFYYLEPGSVFDLYKNDGDNVHEGEAAFAVTASVQTILKAEKLFLRCMQRMSGIASITRRYVQAVKDYPAKIRDTRENTPLLRHQEQDAVRIGGGFTTPIDEHDIIRIKGNLKDFSGGIKKSIYQTKAYLLANNLDRKIEVETHTVEDVRRAIASGGVHRIILDNFSVDEITSALKLIDGKYETEISGRITIENIRDYARTGVDYISVGAIIHNAVNMDLTFKAQVL